MKTKKYLFLFIASAIIFVSLLASLGIFAANSKKEVHLKLFLPQPRFKEQYTKFIDQFAKKYERENNVKVTYDLEIPAPENADQILKTRLAQQEDLDIMSIHALNDIPIYYKAGYLDNLSDQPFVKKLYPSIKPIVSIDNKVVAVPLESLSWGYLYNKKIFNKLGLKPAATLYEMKSVVKKLQDAKITPFLLTYKVPGVCQLFNSLTVGAYVNTSNKDFIVRMNSGKGSYAEIAGMFDIIDLIDANGTDRAMDIEPDAGVAEFVQEKAAMWVMGPWYAESFLKMDKNFSFGVAALPINNDPKATMINLSVSNSLVLSKYSKNKKVAKALLNYFLDDKDSSAFYQSCMFNPVATIHKYEPYPWVQDAMEYVKKGRAYQDPSMPTAVKDEIGKQLQMYYLKSTTKQEIIKVLDKTWRDSVKISK